MPTGFWAKTGTGRSPIRTHTVRPLQPASLAERPIAVDATQVAMGVPITSATRRLARLAVRARRRPKVHVG